VRQLTTGAYVAQKLMPSTCFPPSGQILDLYFRMVQSGALLRQRLQMGCKGLFSGGTLERRVRSTVPVENKFEISRCISCSK
jgi:hypothetical protein